jgi:hypothetical protein
MIREMQSNSTVQQPHSQTKDEPARKSSPPELRQQADTVRTLHLTTLFKARLAVEKYGNGLLLPLQPY